MPLNGNFNRGPRIQINAKIVQDATISIRLANTVAPSYVACVTTPLEKLFFTFWRKTGPFSKAPATMKVAPVSDKDLANERTNAAISEGLMIGDVTVRKATKGTAPNVLDALSNSIL